MYFIIITVVNALTKSNKARKEQERKEIVSDSRRRKPASAPRRRNVLGDLKRLPDLVKEALLIEDEDEKELNKKASYDQLKDYETEDIRARSFLPDKKDYSLKEGLKKDDDYAVHEDILELGLTEMQKAVVMAEVLDKPISLRRK